MKKQVVLVDDLVGKTGGINTVMTILAQEFEALGYPVSFLSFAPVPHESKIYQKYPCNVIQNERIEAIWEKFKNIICQVRLGRILYYRLFIRLKSKLTSSIIRPKLNKHYPEKTVFISMNAKSALLIASPLRQLKSKEFIHIHQLHSQFMGGYAETIKKFMESDLLPYLDALLMLTADDARLATEYFSQHVGYIENPIKRQIHSAEEKEHLLSTTNKRIICITRFADQKRLEWAIQAFDQIAGDFSDWTLELYGDGPEKNKLEKTIENSKHANQIKIFPEVNTDQVTLLWREADLTLISSKFEGMPMSILEAASCATPTVSTPCTPGLNKFVAEGGFLAEEESIESLAESLRLAISDDFQRKEKAKKSLDLVEKHYADKIIRDWISLIDSLKR